MTHDQSKASPSSKDERQPQPHTEGPSPLGESLADPDLTDTLGESATASSRRRGAHRRKLPGRPMGPIKKFFLFLCCFLALYALAGFFLTPFLLTSSLPGYLTKKTNRPVTIGSARFNPFTLHITLKNGIVGQDLAAPDDKVDPIFSFGRIEGKIRHLDLLQGELKIDSLRGNSVFAHLTRQPDGHFNIPALIDKLTKTKTDFDGSYIASLLQDGDLHLTDSRLVFEDIATDTKHNIESISFSLPKRSNKSSALSPRFSAVVNGSPISIGGQSESSATGQSTRLTFSLEKINLTDFLAYLPSPLPHLITKGEADIELFLDYELLADKSYRLELSGSGTARDIWLRTSDKGENKIASATFVAIFQPLTSNLIIKKLSLDQPEIQLHKTADGRYIFPGSEIKKETPSQGKTFLNTLVVKNGRLSYIDQKVEGGFGVIFNDVNLSMDWVETKEEFHAYALNCVTSRQTRIASQGKVFFNKGDIKGLVILHDLPLSALNSYLTKDSGVSITEGLVDKAEADLHLHFQKEGQTLFKLNRVKGTAQNINLNYQGKPWLQADKSSFTDATISSLSPRIRMGIIKSKGLLAHLTPGHPLFSLSTTGKNNTQTNNNIFTELHLAKSSIILQDFPFQKANEIPIKIDELHASAINSNNNTSGEITARFFLSPNNESTLNGSFKLAPLAGNIDLQLVRLPLALFSSKQMQWFVPEIRQGTLDVDGVLNLSDLEFIGKTTLNETAGVNPADASKLFSIKKAFSPDVTLRFQPLALDIKSLIIDNLDLYAILSQEVNSFAPQFINVSDNEPIAKSNLAVQNIELRNGSFHFTDHTVNPVFSHTLSAINGNLSNLSNNGDTPLLFNITGTSQQQAAFNSQGTISFFSKNFTADFRAQLENQPLDPLVPYLEPMAGHSITGGIFDMDVSYKESNGKVNADTKITLSNLDLGDTDLGSKQFPVSVALVTGKDGIIELDIPISGDMTDPSYTFHTAYGKKLRSLISKASVSPFSMLTDFYDPEKISLDHVLFGPGSVEMTQDIDPHFRILKEILDNRPFLTLTLKGYSSGTEDREALLQKKKEEELKKQLAFQGGQSSDVISSYGQEVITPTPTTLDSKTSAILSVSKEELAALAQKRCRHLKDILVDKYGIEEKRIIISPNTTVVPESGAGLPGTRADISLGRLPGIAN